MKKLTLPLAILALMALTAAPAGAMHPTSDMLREDLNKNGDLETVVRDHISALFVVTDLDKNGEADLIQTRSKPQFLCNLDNDSVSEVVIQDKGINGAWQAYGIDNIQLPALVFVSAYDPVRCIGTGEQMLVVSAATFVGTADIDSDGDADITWDSAEAVPSASSQDPTFVQEPVRPNAAERYK
jgi:hypothetical protein